MTENKYYCHKPEDLKNVLNQIQEDIYNQIIIHPDAYKKLMEATDKSFFGKLKYGWRLFALSYFDWRDAMYNEDYVE